MTDLPKGSLFGIPDTLLRRELDDLVEFLKKLWVASYGGPTADLDHDIELSRRFFDPVARGQTIRDRLGEVLPAPSIDSAMAGYAVEPLVTRVDDRRLLVGVEARLALVVLQEADHRHSTSRLPTPLVRDALAYAATTYRRWGTHRLQQVLSLRQGNGKEPMQAVAVGFILALLINRSTHPARGIPSEDSKENKQSGSADAAVFAAIEAFAQVISGRNNRSSAQNRLKGGYAMTEARRRLSDYLRFANQPEGRVIHLQPGSEDTVLRFLAAELARRPTLDSPQLLEAFDRLVHTYRTEAGSIALQLTTYERPADTADLRAKLLALFEDAKQAIRDE